MTRKAFRDEVTSLVKFAGEPYIDDVTDLNTFLNERLRKFAAETLCLYSDSITFTISGGVDTYNIRSTAIVSKEVVRAHNIILDGGNLYNFQGLTGPTSINELSHLVPNYHDTTASKPTRWLLIPPHTIRLWPKPDTTYTTYIQGWYLPSSISVAASADTTEIDLPEEYVRTAAVFAAAHLLIPTTTGQTDYDRMKLLSETAANEMLQLRGQSARSLDGPAIRGTKRRYSGNWI